jgi:hypothetical protein
VVRNAGGVTPLDGPSPVAADPATLLSMSSPILGLRGEDSGHNNHEPLERRGHALTKSRVLVRVVPGRWSAGRR